MIRANVTKFKKNSIAPKLFSAGMPMIVIKVKSVFLDNRLHVILHRLSYLNSADYSITRPAQWQHLKKEKFCVDYLLKQVSIIQKTRSSVKTMNTKSM